MDIKNVMGWIKIKEPVDFHKNFYMDMISFLTYTLKMLKLK